MGASRAEITAFLAREFQQAQAKCEIDEVADRRATIIYRTDHNDLRPGGTVSGPTLMLVADFALYVAILGTAGLIPLAVTTSMTLNFLRKPAGDQDIIGDCRLMKVGKTLVVGEVWLYSKGIDDPVAHAVGTYAIPAQ